MERSESLNANLCTRLDMDGAQYVEQYHQLEGGGSVANRASETGWHTGRVAAQQLGGDWTGDKSQ